MIAMHATKRQRGFVLVVSLLLLVVVTIMALSMFRSFGIQERIAGNMKEKQRALESAQTAEQYAEWWLSKNGGNPLSAVNCTQGLDAATTGVQICSNPLSASSVNANTWQNLGVTYTPLNTTSLAMTFGQASATTVGNYASKPVFYISDLGVAPAGSPYAGGEVYQIDAAGYASDTSATAVIESTYVVYSPVGGFGH